MVGFQRRVLSEAIISVMDKDISEVAGMVKHNHAKSKEVITREGMQERYLDTFIQSLQGLLDRLGDCMNSTTP